MDLIIGGAYQGKCTFAAEKYGLAAEDICDLAVSAPVPARCYVHLEALTRQEAPEAALPLLLAAEVVVAREIGSGVVPIDAGERAWRERHGRLLRQLAVVYIPGVSALALAGAMLLLASGMDRSRSSQKAAVTLIFAFGLLNILFAIIELHGYFRA